MNEQSVRAALQHYIDHSGNDDEDRASEIYHDDDGPWNYRPAIYEFREDKVARETIYIGAGWEAPEWRAHWRAAPDRRDQSSYSATDEDR